MNGKKTKTNIDKSMSPILAVICVSFFLAIIVSIYSLTMLARENTKEIDTMLSYRIYDSISSSLNEPIIVARTMACDDFLVDFLENEKYMGEERAVSTMQAYLNSIKTGLNYDSAFLVSESSRRYYTYEGLNKIVDPANDAHDVWYSLFVEKNEPYDLDVDSDEMNHGQWTVFVNTRIEDEHGKLLGVCGVGVQMVNLQELFLASEQEYGVKINLVDKNGLVQVDTEDINIENAWLEDVLGPEKTTDYTYQTLENNEFAVTKYVEYLGWYLVVRSAPTSISREFMNVILLNVSLFLLVMGVLIITITLILRRTKKERDEREKLLITSERAIAASEAKSSFLSGMSHEIRTPINAVLGMNEMILREAKDSSILEYASNIQTAGKTLLSLINSILDFSKIEEGKMEIIPVRYDTASVINNLVVSISERAKAKRLELIVEADPGLPARMVGDDVRLSQIIMNLLTNAVKYTEKGSVRFSISGGERANGNIALKVSIQDTGIGIKQEDMPRLFESFERLDEVRNHSIEGTGLGMSIVTRLLEMMGSRLEVESTYGKGSTFSFTVMQQIADETPIGDYAQRLDLSRRAVANEILRAENARVLVVDDNEMNLKVAKNLLKLFGIVPDLADSGFEAIELMRKEHYNIVFLDHMMPKMDGVETLRLLKKEQLIPDDTKVIVLTANAVLGAKEQYLEEGFDDYLSKPIDVSRLEELLIHVLPQELYTLRTAEDAEESAESESSAVDELQKAGFDTAAGLRFAAGDRDFYLELASGFAESAEKNLPQIRADFEKRDWEDYQIRVHALKSTARQIGANELSELALRQETAAKERNISEIEKGTENLLLKYEQTVKLLRDILHFDASEPTLEEAKETISMDDLRKKLGEARACIENFEAESALEILKPLASHSFAEAAVGDALRKIIDALEDFDTFTAEEGINAIMERVEK